MPQYHLKIEVSSSKILKFFSVFPSPCTVLRIDQSLRTPFLTQSIKEGQYVLLYLRAWGNFWCPSFSLSFLKAETSLLRKACINYVLSCYCPFLCPNKSLHSLKISASTLFSPFLFLSYTHINAAQSHIEPEAKEKCRPLSTHIKIPFCIWNRVEKVNEVL